MFWYHFAFLALLVGTSVFFLVLDLLNFQHGKSLIREKSEWLKEKFEVEDPDRLLGYFRLKTGFGQLQSFLGLGVLLFVLYSGLFAWLVRRVQETDLGFVGEGTLLLVLLTGAMSVYSLPFSAFKTFVIEELYDFNQQSVGIWVRDQIKGLVVSMVITALLGGLIFWVISVLPGTWWLVGWGIIVLFGLSMQIIYPRLIAPLFYEFKKVEEGDLRDAVEDVFSRAGFSCSQIYTMDASRKSSHSNAYFTGFGRTKRVVLFDTLIDQMNHSQVQGVLAHELAHWKKGHIWWRIGRQAVKMGVLFGVLFWLVNAEWIYGMFSIAPDLQYAGLMLGLLWLSPVSQWLSPVENWFSINDEREADEFAAEVMDSGQPLIEALYRLVGENLSNPFPHPLYAAFHYNHPPVPDRVRYLQKQEGEERSDEVME